MKILIGIVFVAVIFSLGSALFYMTSQHSDPAKVTRALAWRVGLSALLIVLLLVSWKFDLIE
ncbi:MAG: twin transmembrane helix small protein [Woeseiaceae bacterium]